MPKCQFKGHLARFCPKKDQGPGQASKGSRAGKIKVGVVRCRKIKSVKANRVEYDNELTPNMKNVALTPLGKVKSKTKTKTTIMDAFPDSGWEQTLISEDLIKPMGLVLENDKKLIQAVDGSAVRCSGSTAIKVEYQGQEAKIRALVTPSLKDEVILSKKTLQKLSVLPKGFPNVQVVQTRAVKAQVGENDDKEALSDKECSSNTSKASETEGWNEDSELNDEVKKLKKKYETVFITEGGLTLIRPRGGGIKTRPV